MKNLLAIDLGASSGRAVLGKISEQSLQFKEIHRFDNCPVQMGDTLYWDAPRLLHEIGECIRRGELADRGRLAGIGLDTWGVDFGLLDAKGRLLANPVHYRDPRTNGIMPRVFKVVPREKIFAATGIQFLQLNTLFQLAAMKFRNDPALEAAETLLMMPDLFNYFLSGKKVSELTIATTSQLYALEQKNWAFDLIESLDLPARIFPKIVKPGTILGFLSKDLFPETRRAAPVIAPACHDTGSAVAAVPASSDDRPGNWAYLSSGTWSLLGLEIKTPIVNELALKYNFTNEGGVARTYRFLKNIAGLWFLQECRRIWSREDRRELSHQDLIKAAAAARPFAAFINPDHPSFLNPSHMPAAILDFCRQTRQALPESRGAMIRSVLESLALKYRLVRQQLEAVSGKRIEKLYVVGGGARNDLLNQFTANALGIPVLAGPSEATALGNLMVQALALKILPDLKTARSLIRKSFPLKIFEPKDHAQWQDAFGKFELGVRA